LSDSSIPIKLPFLCAVEYNKEQGGYEVCNSAPIIMECSGSSLHLQAGALVLTAYPQAPPDGLEPEILETVDLPMPPEPIAGWTAPVV
jgi:hypothetical protein